MQSCNWLDALFTEWLYRNNLSGSNIEEDKNGEYYLMYKNGKIYIKGLSELINNKYGKQDDTRGEGE